MILRLGNSEANAGIMFNKLSYVVGGDIKEVTPPVVANAFKLISSDNYYLKDSNEYYLLSNEEV